MNIKGFVVVAALSSAAVLVSCSKKTVVCTGDGFPKTDAVVYLIDATSEKNEIVDSVKLNDGSFAFNGEKLKNGLYYLKSNTSERYLVYLDNESEVKAHFDPELNTVVLKGSKYDKEINDLYTLTTSAVKVMDQCEMEAQKLPRNADEMTEEQKEQYQKLVEQYQGATEKLINGSLEIAFANPSSPIALHVVAMYLYNLDEGELQRAKDIVMNYKGGENLDTWKRCKEFFDLQEATAAGKPFIDFKVFDAEGNTHALSEFAGKGKVVLVDFWASWCKYCRAAFPDLKEIYNEFAPKGFEIFGYSLDKDKDKWKAQVEADQLPWIQFVTDDAIAEKGEKLYGVRGIPFTLLIDKDGSILGTNLEMDQLRQKLTEKLQ